MERRIRRRRETPEIGWGAWRVLETDPPALLGHRCDWAGRTFVAVHNLSGDPCVAHVDLATDLPEEPRLLELFDRDGTIHEIDTPELEVKLEGYGYRWLRIHSAGQLTHLDRPVGVPQRYGGMTELRPP